MSDWFEKIAEIIKNLNAKVEDYKGESVIQSLPSVAYVNRAKKAMAEGRYKDALDILQQAESLPQQDALVYKYQGIIYDKLFRFEDAVRVYKIAANLSPNDKIIWKNLGFSLLSTKNFDEAQESFENASKITPNSAEVFLGWGMAFMKQDKISEAREKFITSIKLDKYNSHAVFLAAVMEFKLKMYNEAEEKLKFLVKVAPNEANYYEYSRLNYVKENYEQAEYYAKMALTLNKNMLQPYLMLGNVYCIKGEKDKALEAFKTAEELDLINDTLYIQWANALIKFEMYGEAFDALNKAEAINNSSEDLKILKAFCNVVLGNFEGSREVFENILKEDENPYKSLALHALGLISLADGDFTNAIVNFKAAVKENPSETINYYTIAKAYQAKGDLSNTKEYFETALKFAPNRLKTYLDYAGFLVNSENYADANRKLRKALKLDENNLDILNMLFYVNYILVKDNVCEYNIKETLNIEKQIKVIDENGFKYPDKSAELADMLNKLHEKE